MQKQKLLIDKKATLEILIGVILLGTGPMFVKFVKADGTLVAFYRLLFAALMLAIPAILSRRGEPKQAAGKIKIIWLAAGGVAFAVNLALWCSALNYTSAAVVTLLDNTAPVWVGVFSWLVLRERQGLAYWFGLCLAIAGGILLVSGGLAEPNSQQPLGIALSIASGISYAAYILVTQQARKTYSSVFYSWMVSVIGAIVLLIFGLLSGSLLEILTGKSYFLIFLMSLSSQVLGWYLVNHALGKLPSTAASVALVGQPVVTTILGVVILGEFLSGMQLAGIVICLAGILLVQRTR